MFILQKRNNRMGLTLDDVTHYRPERGENKEPIQDYQQGGHNFHKAFLMLPIELRHLYYSEDP